MAIWLAAPRLADAQQTTGATFGEVIKLPGGTPSDIVLDELRQRLYLVNNSTNTVYIYDYANNRLSGAIGVGKSPVAGAISMRSRAWVNVGTPASAASPATRRYSAGLAAGA